MAFEKDPKRVAQGRKNKRRGSSFESRVRAYLRKYGWYVQRNTFGLYDIIALPPSVFSWNSIQNPMPEPLMEHFWQKQAIKLQPTTQKYPPKDKIQALKDNDHKWIGVAYLVQPDYSKPRHPLLFRKVSEL